MNARPYRPAALGRGWLCAAILALLIAPALAAEPQRLLLIGQGPDGHPRGTHQYESGLKLLSELLSGTSGLSVQTVKADEPWTDGPRQLAECDGAVLFLAEGARWLQADPRRHAAFMRLAQRGGGLSALHWATGTKSAEPIAAFVALWGGCHGGPDRKYQVFDDAQLTLPAPSHPIVAGLADFRAHDEFYYRLKFTTDKGLQPLVDVAVDGQQQTVAWCWNRPDGGRSFGFTGLHFHDNWQRPEYRKLVSQGVLWTMRLWPAAGAD